MAKISVVIPSYNTSEFIEETLRSVLNQDYPDSECIVMDGGSTDGTLDILRQYEGKITWRSERDEGQSDAINKGLKLASGDILAFLNADDVYEKDCLRKVADFFENHPGTMWVYGKCRIIGKNGEETHRPMTWLRNLWLRHYTYGRLLIVNFIPQPSVFWRRELTDEIGTFPVEDQWVMDYEYWLRAGRKYDPGFIPDYLASFRIHPSSKTSVNPTRNVRDGMKAARKHTDSKRAIMLGYLVNSGTVLFYYATDALSRIRRTFRGAST